MTRKRPLTDASKRCLDLAGAFLLLVLSSPVLLAGALLARLDGPGPVLVRQTLLGRDGWTFPAFRLRTAAEPGDAAQAVLHPVLAWAGKRLRGAGLDQAPQLLNVLLGRMSLVGPRPLPPEFLRSCTPFERRRLDVLPGLTGWQQVAGPCGLRSERMALDVWYVEHGGFWLDLWILLCSARLVFGVRVGPGRSDPSGARALPRTWTRG